MRFWLSGPRLFNGLVRPGISFSGKELAVWGKKPPTIAGAGMLGIFKRDTDGAIFLGVTDQNGENEHLANVKPVAAFAFSSADAAITAEKVRLSAWPSISTQTACWWGQASVRQFHPSEQKRPPLGFLRSLPG